MIAGAATTPPRYLIPGRTRKPSPPSFVPATHARLVERLRRWDGVVACVAPAGYGKSALLARWCAEETRDVAWVNLDASDRDLVVLATYIHEAFAPHLGSAADHVLGELAQARPDVVGRVAPMLLNALERLARPLVLVLDGLDRVPAGDSLHLLQLLLEVRPPLLTVALASRFQPSRGLARPRAGGQVLDVRDDDLRLPADELDALLAATVPDLDDDVRRALTDESRGWLAPALLVARAVRPGAGDVAQVRDLVRRENLGLLVDEVLAQLHPTTRDAVVVLGDLPWFDTSLVRAQFSAVDAVDLVDELRRHGLVRPHPGQAGGLAVAQDLVAALRERQPSGAFDGDGDGDGNGDGDGDGNGDAVGPVTLDVTRAAEFYESRGDLASALDVLVRAGADARAAELVASHWEEPFDHGHLQVVDEWLRMVGPSAVQADPRLLLAEAHVGIARRDPVALDRALGALAETEHTLPGGRAVHDGHVAFLRAQQALRFRGDAATGLVEARRAAETVWRTPVEGAAADLLLVTALVVAGEDDEAAAVTRAALSRHAAAAGTVAHAGLLAAGAIIAAFAPRPDVSLVGRLAAGAWDVVDRAGLEGWASVALVHVARGYAALVAGDLAAAAAATAATRRVLRRGLDRSMTMLAAHLEAEIAGASGDAAATRAAVERALVQLGSWQDPGPQVERYHRLARRLGVGEQDLPDPLTDRELEILRALPRHRTRADLAAATFISVDTVKSHLASIYRKLRVSGRVGAIERARGMGLL